MNPNQNTPSPEMPVAGPPIIPPQQNETPVQNEQQPISAEPVMQQPIQTVVGSSLITAPVPVKKSKLKWLITIAIAIVVLGGTAVSAWFLAPDMFSVILPLKEYSFDKFSVSIPEAYKVLDSNGSKPIDINDVPKDTSTMYFKKAIGSGSDDKKKVAVMISVGEPLDNSRLAAEGILNGLFVDYHKDDIINNLGVNARLSVSPYKSTNVSIRKYSKDGMTVYSAYGDYSIEVFNESGTFSGTFFVSDSKLAQIYILSSGGEDVKSDTSKIINSFKLK